MKVVILSKKLSNRFQLNLISGLWVAYLFIGKDSEIRLSWCIFKELTGIDCFLCGITRACVAIINFNFVEAFYLNSLSFALMLFSVALIFTLPFPKLNLVLTEMPTKKYFVPVITTGFLLNLIF